MTASLRRSLKPAHPAAGFRTRYQIVRVAWTGWTERLFSISGRNTNGSMRGGLAKIWNTTPTMAVGQSREVGSTIRCKKGDCLLNGVVSLRKRVRDQRIERIATERYFGAHQPMTTRTLIRRLEATEKASKIQSRFSPDCICFPDKEPPFFCEEFEEEMAAQVKCPLHGERFKRQQFFIYVSSWLREKEPARRQRLSSQHRKAWDASFPTALNPPVPQLSEVDTAKSKCMWE
jgi:hypothetical protein